MLHVLLYSLDPNSRLSHSFLPVFIPSIFMHHLHLHRLQPFLSSSFLSFLLPSCSNFNCYPCPRRGPLPKPFSLPNDAVYSSQFPAIRLSRLSGFFSMWKHFSRLLFLFLPFRTYEEMAACFTISSFPSLLVCACAHGRPLCDPLYVQRTSLGRVRGTRLPCQLSIWQFACCDARIWIRWVWFGLGLLLITSFFSFRLHFSFAIYIVKTD